MGIMTCVNIYPNWLLKLMHFNIKQVNPYQYKTSA